MPSSFSLPGGYVMACGLLTTAAAGAPPGPALPAPALLPLSFPSFPLTLDVPDAVAGRSPFLLLGRAACPLPCTRSLADCTSRLALLPPSLSLTTLAGVAADIIGFLTLPLFTPLPGAFLTPPAPPCAPPLGAAGLAALAGFSGRKYRNSASRSGSLPNSFCTRWYTSSIVRFAW